MHFIENPGVLRALNPLRGLMFLASPNNHAGLRILGFVFLCTTGAEALYSDMGHVGKSNIYVTWPVVKLCLIMNYLGQGAWCLANASNTALAELPSLNPFYQMLPEWMRPFAILLSTVAAIIASQALITGSFTLVSEATRLDLMPHLKIDYPSETKGQLYIPLVNNLMWVGCIFIVLLFQNSERMEAAYGLAITVTMLMTTTLLVSYLAGVLRKPALAVVFALVFGAIELSFFISCCTMFFDGGYVMIILSAALAYVMYVWRRDTAIERTQTVYLPIHDYIDQLSRLRNDTTHHVRADNLVFLTNDSSPDLLDRDILYSILDKRPKRARTYWFINVHVTDEPYTNTYTVNTFGTNFIFKVQLQLGFKVNQRINTYLRQVVADLIATGELAPQPRQYSIYRKPSNVGDFRFCMVRKVLDPESNLSPRDYRTMNAKYAIRSFCGSPIRWYGLENSSVIFETVPLFSKIKPATTLKRVPSDHHLDPTHSRRKVARHRDEGVDIFSADMESQREASAIQAAEGLIGGHTAQFEALRADDEENE